MIQPMKPRSVNQSSQQWQILIKKMLKLLTIHFLTVSY